MSLLNVNIIILLHQIKAWKVIGNNSSLILKRPYVNKNYVKFCDILLSAMYQRKLIYWLTVNIIGTHKLISVKEEIV